MWLSVIYWLILFILMHVTTKHCFNSCLEINNTHLLDIHNIEKLYYASLIILTFLLVWIAWVQLSKLHSTSQSDFLLRIINHFSDKSILQALKIIHRIRLQAERIYIHEPDKITKTIAMNISDMRDNPNNINEYFFLKNFLDYLEHIAYLCNQGAISIEDVENCIGERISWYYYFFEDLINRFKSLDPKNSDKMYIELKKLVDRINTK